jgi:hypothetical protein
VLVLEAGAVIEEGTPAELIAKGGWFAALAAGHPEDEAEAGGENGTDTGEVAEADGEQDSDELATGDDDEDSADGADEEPDDDADEEDPDDDADRDADEEEPDDDADEEEAAEPAADADAPAVRDVPPASKPRVKPPRRR